MESILSQLVRDDGGYGCPVCQKTDTTCSGETLETFWIYCAGCGFSGDIVTAMAPGENTTVWAGRCESMLDQPIPVSRLQRWQQLRDYEQELQSWWDAQDQTGVSVTACWQAVSETAYVAPSAMEQLQGLLKFVIGNDVRGRIQTGPKPRAKAPVAIVRAYGAPGRLVDIVCLYFGPTKQLQVASMRKKSQGVCGLESAAGYPTLTAAWLTADPVVWLHYAVQYANHGAVSSPVLLLTPDAGDVLDGAVLGIPPHLMLVRVEQRFSWQLLSACAAAERAIAKLPPPRTNWVSMLLHNLVSDPLLELAKELLRLDDYQLSRVWDMYRVPLVTAQKALLSIGSERVEIVIDAATRSVIPTATKQLDQQVFRENGTTIEIQNGGGGWDVVAEFRVRLTHVYRTEDTTYYAGEIITSRQVLPFIGPAKDIDSDLFAWVFSFARDHEFGEVLRYSPKFGKSGIQLVMLFSTPTVQRCVDRVGWNTTKTILHLPHARTDATGVWVPEEIPRTQIKPFAFHAFPSEPTAVESRDAWRVPPRRSYLAKALWAVAAVTMTNWLRERRHEPYVSITLSGEGAPYTLQFLQELLSLETTPTGTAVPWCDREQATKYRLTQTGDSRIRLDEIHTGTALAISSQHVHLVIPRIDATYPDTHRLLQVIMHGWAYVMTANHGLPPRVDFVANRMARAPELRRAGLRTWFDSLINSTFCSEALSPPVRWIAAALLLEDLQLVRTDQATTLTKHTGIWNPPLDTAWFCLPWKFWESHLSAGYGVPLRQTIAKRQPPLTKLDQDGFWCSLAWAMGNRSYTWFKRFHRDALSASESIKPSTPDTPS